jgi:uncharacterized membrane protein YfbV (UPF0208 family)
METESVYTLAVICSQEVLSKSTMPMAISTGLGKYLFTKKGILWLVLPHSKHTTTNDRGPQTPLHTGFDFSQQ